jgi:superfamily II DNA/RNA helicase
MLKNDKNIIAQAQTGTGKQRIWTSSYRYDQCGDQKCQALILVPTRE